MLDRREGWARREAFGGGAALGGLLSRREGAAHRSRRQGAQPIRRRRQRLVDEVVGARGHHREGRGTGAGRRRPRKPLRPERAPRSAALPHPAFYGRAAVSLSTASPLARFRRSAQCGSGRARSSRPAIIRTRDDEAALRGDRPRHDQLGRRGLRRRARLRRPQRAGRLAHAVGGPHRRARHDHHRGQGAEAPRVGSGEHARRVQAPDGHDGADRVSGRQARPRAGGPRRGGAQGVAGRRPRSAWRRAVPRGDQRPRAVRAAAESGDVGGRAPRRLRESRARPGADRLGARRRMDRRDGAGALARLRHRRRHLRRLPARDQRGISPRRRSRRRQLPGRARPRLGHRRFRHPEDQRGGRRRPEPERPRLRARHQEAQGRGRGGEDRGGARGGDVHRGARADRWPRRRRGARSRDAQRARAPAGRAHPRRLQAAPRSARDRARGASSGGARRRSDGMPLPVARGRVAHRARSPTASIR